VEKRDFTSVHFMGIPNCSEQCLGLVTNEWYRWLCVGLMPVQCCRLGSTPRAGCFS
jgi:hypothetical protein